MILRYTLSPISKVNNEDKTLLQVLQKEFNGKLNLARIKFLCAIIQALCKVQTVKFERLAGSFDSRHNPVVLTDEFNDL